METRVTRMPIDLRTLALLRQEALLLRILHLGMYYFYNNGRVLTATSMTDDQVRHSYTLVHLYGVTEYGSDVKDCLDGKLGDLWDLPCIIELPDETWELVVHWSYIEDLSTKLKRSFPSCCVLPDYDPTEVGEAETERFGHYHVVKQQTGSTFFKRAESMRDAWPIAAKYYSLRAGDIRAGRSCSGGETL